MWIYAFVAFACFFYLDWRWVHSAPSLPNPIRGLVYSHDEHGSVTYLSAFQATSLVLLFAVPIPLALIGFFIVPKKNLVSKRGFLSASWKWDNDDPSHVGRIGSICGAIAALLTVFLIGPVLVTWLNSRGIVLSLG